MLLAASFSSLIDGMNEAHAVVKLKIVVADDEPQIRFLLRDLLSEQFDVELASNGKEAVDLIFAHKPDVILLDVMMPDMDGVSVVQKLRADDRTKHIPVLMLSAVNSSQDRVKAFKIGADDYISKPFEVEELLIRINSKLHRAKELRNIPPDRIDVGNVVMDLRSKEVMLDGKTLELSPVEFGILKLLLAHFGDVVTRKDIMKDVWGDEALSDRLIDAHVTSLRKKIAGFNGAFQTVYGQGYRLKKLH